MLRFLGGLTALLLVLSSGLTGSNRAGEPGGTSPLSTDELIRLADEAELRGDNAERGLLVQRALKQNSSHASARAHAGHLRDGRRWVSFEDYAAKQANSVLLKRYHEMRFQRMTPQQAHIAIARWCRQQHLPERERFHWLMVLQRTPDQPDALAALDLVWADGRSWTRDELRQFRDEQRKKQQWSKRMAKFLKTGDLLHGLHGSWPTQSVDEQPPQAAFNLVVDGYGTYFVSQTGLLVHDNTFRQPTTVVLPGYHRP